MLSECDLAGLQGIGVLTFVDVLVCNEFEITHVKKFRTLFRQHLLVTLEHRGKFFAFEIIPGLFPHHNNRLKIGTKVIKMG